MDVITRFAPSPTGNLHLGGARTALFNYVFTARHGGKFFLRIEDTDKARSKKEFTDNIIASLSWLNIPYEGEPYVQSHKIKRHIEIANLLLEKNCAYYCYCPPKQTTKYETNKNCNCSKKYGNKKANNNDSDPVVRLNIPKEEKTTIMDLVQGKITIQNKEIENFAILRSDGSPTYMLSVVVDDHDMNITHIIRGDDHINNSFKQKYIYDAMQWRLPTFAHIPLIHSADGKKLSKRMHTSSVLEYKQLGYLNEALFNYLILFSWSYNNQTLITPSTVIKNFSLDHISKSPAKFDMDKLNFLNNNYIKIRTDEDIYQHLVELYQINAKKDVAIAIIHLVKNRSKTLLEINDIIENILNPELDMPEIKNLIGKASLVVLQKIYNFIKFKNIPWNIKEINTYFKKFIDENKLKFKDIGIPLRLALLGSKSSPDIITIIYILGKKETMKRIVALL